MNFINGRRCSSGLGIFVRVWPQNQLVGEGFGRVQEIHILLVLGPRLFFLDEGMDQPGHGPTAKAPGRIWLGPVWISHKLQIKRFFGSYVIIVVKGDLLTLTAFKEFGHRYLSF